MHDRLSCRSIINDGNRNVITKSAEWFCHSAVFFVCLRFFLRGVFEWLCVDSQWFQIVRVVTSEGRCKKSCDFFAVGVDFWKVGDYLYM